MMHAKPECPVGSCPLRRMLEAQIEMLNVRLEQERQNHLITFEKLHRLKYERNQGLKP